MYSRSQGGSVLLVIWVTSPLLSSPIHNPQSDGTSPPPARRWSQMVARARMKATLVPSGA